MYNMLLIAVDIHNLVQAYATKYWARAWFLNDDFRKSLFRLIVYLTR